MHAGTARSAKHTIINILAVSVLGIYVVSILGISCFVWVCQNLSPLLGYLSVFSYTHTHVISVDDAVFQTKGMNGPLSFMGGGGGPVHMGGGGGGGGEVPCSLCALLLFSHLELQQITH